MPRKTNDPIKLELHAMQRINQLLSELTPESKTRVLAWLIDVQKVAGRKKGPSRPKLDRPSVVTEDPGG